MTRVIVHAGFHKTGTTSLQDFLAENSKALKPHFDYYGKTDFLAAGAHARIYGQRTYFWRRLRFRRSFRRFLKSIPDASTIVLSRETFAGAMPGHRDALGRMVQGYTDAAIPLATEIVTQIRRRFGLATDIQFIYTTRAPDPWLCSVYGHLLRSIHLTQNFESFRAGFTNPPDPEKDAQKIARALVPIPVHIARLEDFSDHPEGPAAAILDLVGVPDVDRAKLRPAKHRNPGQSAETMTNFLTLNRSGKTKAALKAMKDRIISDGSGQ